MRPMSTPAESLNAGAAVFIGAARNCEPYLERALERWAILRPCFSSARFIVAENDSTDRTKDILAAWASGAPDRRVLCLDGLAERDLRRSERLAIARNRLLDEIIAAEELRTAEFLVVMDLDEASLAITRERLCRCMEYTGWDALFANQFLYYYDVWALREARRSPDDWVDRVAVASASYPESWARFRHLTWRARPIWPLASPLPVQSAFGGFAIYRMPVALTSRYQGRQNGRVVCEHVPFNERLAHEGARLFIHPGLINMLPSPLYRLGRKLNLI
jgi:hypothetical protein